MTPGDRVLIESIPEAIGSTERVCSSVNVATTRAGINMDAVALMGRTIRALAERTADSGGVGCAKLVTFANVPEDNPFVAGAFHGGGEPDCVIHVGVSGPGVILSALRRLRETGRPDPGAVAETIKRMAFKVTRAGELIGREVARRLGDPVRFGIVDLSLAPTPAIGDSVRDPQALGPSTRRARLDRCARARHRRRQEGRRDGVVYVGSLSGAFIRSADHAMAYAVKVSALTLEKLEAMTSVCSVGLDMVCVPGDTPPETLSAIIADEAAIGVVNHKTTAVRIIPVPGKGVGDTVVFGGLLGEAPIMAVNRFGCADFIAMGGRIPAPITSLRN